MVKMDEIAQIKRLMLDSGMTYLAMTSPAVSLTLVMAGHEVSEAGEVTLQNAGAARRMDDVPVPAPVAGRAPSVPPTPDGRDVVRARQVGVFALRHVTRRQGPLAPGVAVVEGETLGFVRDGLILHPVIAERAGVIADVVLQEHAVVGYGTSLFVYRA